MKILSFNSFKGYDSNAASKERGRGGVIGRILEKIILIDDILNETYLQWSI